MKIKYRCYKTGRRNQYKNDKPEVLADAEESEMTRPSGYAHTLCVIREDSIQNATARIDWCSLITNGFGGFFWAASEVNCRPIPHSPGEMFIYLDQS